MKVLRWIVCFPFAATMSWLTWITLRSVECHITYGGGFLNSTYGVMPLILWAGIPTAVFEVVGVWTSPSSKRITAFVLLPLSILFSGGGMELLELSVHGPWELWLTAALSIVAGALAGLSASLWILKRRHSKWTSASQIESSAS